MLQLSVVKNSADQWFVRIEGMNRVSLTPCQSEGQARELLYLAKTNPVVAERLHGLRE